VKIRKILGCLKFGSANSPRVRGGRSAVNETCLPDALQKSFKPQNYTADGPQKDRGRSTDHRFNLQALDTPMGCLLSNTRPVRQVSAESPPVLKKNLPVVVFNSGLMLKLGCGRSAHGLRTVRSWCFQEDPDS